MTSKETKTNLISFIQSLVSTNSPSARLNSLYELMRIEPDLLSREEQDHLLGTFKNEVEKKSTSGKTHITKRWNGSQETPPKKSKSSGSDWACLKSKFGSRCTTCNERYEMDDIIFLHRTNNKGYHIDCVPEEAKQDELAMSHLARLQRNGDA